MEFSTELHTIKIGWTIVYIEIHGIKNITKLILYTDVKKNASSKNKRTYLLD